MDREGLSLYVSESYQAKQALTVEGYLGHGQLIPWMADFSRANLDQSVGRGSKNKKTFCLS